MRAHLNRLSWMAGVVAIITIALAGSANADSQERMAKIKAAQQEDIQLLVDRAESTLSHFRDDPSQSGFLDRLKQAKGILIAPKIVRAGFIFAGTGGPGVFLARLADTGNWSAPAFYSTGGASVGLQVGGEKAEMVFLLMTQKAVDSLLATSIKLGADASVAAGTMDAGAKAQVADILVFSRGKGFYGGISLEGVIVRTRDDINSLYYGKEIRTLDIIEGRTAAAPKADALIDLVGTLSK